ncbi:hypothetical protein VXS12_00020 [Acinetobacter baumannii]|uniref:hypothetical protein n=1 Tax=Acinetobacter baumannii TaxID=470 RepID=UPI0021EFF7D4|nr:hypothetical protein [Acinetobacter baumannii]CAI3121959.1 hypothetical protein MWMV4_MWMV4_03569 [Acinetobacter baumannii]HCA5034129.1 hypothetical protein [Acinetobacter baumannii]
MRMTFIAYDPESGKKIKLKEHVLKNGHHDTRVYYSDEKDNFVYNPLLKQYFEIKHYTSIMKVEIAKKLYYLIGEY